MPSPRISGARSVRFAVNAGREYQIIRACPKALGVRYRTDEAPRQDGETVPLAGFIDAVVWHLASKHASIMPIRVLDF